MCPRNSHVSPELAIKSCVPGTPSHVSPELPTVKLGDRSLDSTFDATILAGDSPEAFNDVERPNRVVPEKTQLKFNQGVVHLPPHSLIILRIR